MTIGVIGRGVPLELLDAADAAPRRLTGAVGADTTEADRLLGRGLDPHANAVLAGLLATGFAGLDAIVCSSDAEASVRVFYVLRELARVEPDAGVPPVHLVDVLQQARDASRDYTRQEFSRLAHALEAWTGRPLDTDALANAIRHRERARRALAEARSALSGTAFLDLRLRLDREGPDAMLAALQGATGAAPAEDAVRVILTGSGHDESGVSAAIEAAGARIVGDDHPSGELGLAAVATEPTLEALADRYWADRPAPHRASPAERAEHLAALVSERRADGVLVYTRRADDAPRWDVAAQRARAGVPVAIVEGQEYGRIDDEQLRRALDELREGADRG